MADLVQLTMPVAGLALEPTISMLRGEQYVYQCAECGVVACIPDCVDYKASDKLGPCPRCGRRTWWRQRLPVAGLRDAEGAQSLGLAAEVQS